jgi:DNA-binding IclR family transcriptional regulator
MDTTALIDSLDARDQKYVRQLASQGGLPWSRAPRMFARFQELGIVTKQLDSENGCDYAFATDDCKAIAKILRGKR